MDCPKVASQNKEQGHEQLATLIGTRFPNVPITSTDDCVVEI